MKYEYGTVIKGTRAAGFASVPQRGSLETGVGVGAVEYSRSLIASYIVFLVPRTAMTGILE